MFPSLSIFAGNEVASPGGFDPNCREEIRRDLYTDGFIGLVLTSNPCAPILING
jgi:hypothetical protein